MATQLEEFNSRRGVREADTVVGTAAAFLHIECLEVDEHSLSDKQLNFK